MQTATVEELTEIDDIGEIMAVSVVEFFEEPQNRMFLQRLAEAGVHCEDNSEEELIDKRFDGKVFVLTGTLEKYKRSEASAIIERYGGKTSSSVSKKTDYVLAGADAGSKLEKAQALGIAVISEDEFEEMTK